MYYLLGLLVVLNIADAAITHSLIGLGLATEGNSFLAPLVGERMFYIVKVSGTLLAALILWDVHRRHPRLALGFTFCAVAAYGAIVLWNSSLFPELSFLRIATG